MKKIFACVLVLVLAVSLAAPSTFAAGFEAPESVEVTAASAYFVNLDTGIVMYEKNPHERRSIASLTKLMTALLLVENVADLDGTVWTAETALYVSPITDSSASTADIRPREQVTARSVLYAMLLPSGNEAAAIAAYALGNGNLENFYAMMNARAAELGCTDTNFTNPHGLIGMEGGNYSSAYDLAQIAKACWANEIFRAVCTATSYDMPATNIHAEPYTVRTTVKTQIEGTAVYRSYFRGMKTGSTMDAGRNYVSAAINSNAETFIGVVLGCPWDPAEDGFAYSFHDAINLYDWMFANFSVQPTLDVASPINEVKVRLSNEADSVKVYPAADLRTILPNSGAGDLLEKDFALPESVDAPVKQGDKLGTVTIRVNGVEIGTVDLLAGQDIERTWLLYAFDRLGAFFSGTYFKVVCVLTVIYLVGYAGIWFYLQNEAKKRRAAARRRALRAQQERQDRP